MYNTDIILNIPAFLQILFLKAKKNPKFLISKNAKIHFYLCAYRARTKVSDFSYS
jgi:hypothetical protein